VVVVCTPKYIWPSDHLNYPLTCKYMILKHMPYEGKLENMIDPSRDEKTQYVEIFNQFLSKNQDSPFETFQLDVKKLMNP
jgi:hypothetical protein